MTDIGLGNVSPRSGFKRDREYGRRRDSPPRGGRYDRKRSSPPRKKRREEYERRGSPERRRSYDDRYRDESPGRLKRSGQGHSHSYDGPLLSYNQFLDTLDDRPRTDVAQKRYDEYRQEYDKRNLKQFFKTHQNEEWFKEKYHPLFLQEEFIETCAKMKNIADLFFEEFRSGALDKINYDADNNLSALTDYEQKEINPNNNGQQQETKPDTVVESTTDNQKDAGVTSEIKENNPEQTEIQQYSIDRIKESEKKPLKARTTPFSYLEPPESPTTLYLPKIPTTCSRKSLLEMLNTIKTGNVVQLLISDPHPSKNFRRVGWVTYSSEEAAKEAYDKLNGIPFPRRDAVLELTAHHIKYQPPKPYLTPALASIPSRILKDLELVRKLTRHFDEFTGIEKNVLLSRSIINTKEDSVKREAQEKTETDKNMDLEEKVIQKTDKELLDLFIEYLKRVHWHVYYTCETYKSFEELQIQAGKVFRGTQNHSSSEDGKAWGRELEKKIDDKILFDVKYTKESTGESAIDKKIEEFYDEKTFKESDERYRCEICHKMFKAAKFVQKHLTVKHNDLIDKFKQEAYDMQFLNNYCNDPRHITPSSAYDTSSKSDRKEEDIRSSRDYDRSPRRDRDDRSPVREHSRERKKGNNYSGGRGSRRRFPNQRNFGRGRDFGRSSDNNNPPEGFKDKIDPREQVTYVDLDKPPEDNFEIDYEKALAAFASGGQ